MKAERMRHFRPRTEPQPRGRPALVRSSGPLAGLKYFLDGAVTRIGRNPDNDIVMRGADAAVVSGKHAEIHAAGPAFRIKDLGSTNGTFVNGRRVTEIVQQAPCTIQLGAGGPEMVLSYEDEEPAGAQPLNSTVVVLPGAAAADAQDPVRDAVARVRAARGAGVTGQTMAIMRDVIQAALGKTRRRFKAAIAVLAAALVCVSAYSWWQIRELTQAKSAIDSQIRDLETQLARAENSQQADRIIDTLDRYQDQARSLQHNLFYRLGTWQREEFIRHEIRLLLAEFGAEQYSIPPEFVSAVQRYLERYQGPDRPNIARALGQMRPVMQSMRRVFEQYNLPPDLVFMVLAESALDNHSHSSAGASGLWQFTPGTARDFGLRVGGDADERYDPIKATHAGARYVRQLILEFGAGSSVMLAMAAYNVGPGRVKSAIYKQVTDPIKQRHFWYLYRRHALPVETREYVPKVIAAMIIGRNPKRFGF